MTYKLHDKKSRGGGGGKKSKESDLKLQRLKDIPMAAVNGLLCTAGCGLLLRLTGHFISTRDQLCSIRLANFRTTRHFVCVCGFLSPWPARLEDSLPLCEKKKKNFLLIRLAFFFFPLHYSDSPVFQKRVASFSAIPISAEHFFSSTRWRR